MSEELVKKLRGIAISKENTDFAYGRKAPLYCKETEIEWEAATLIEEQAARIEGLEQKLRSAIIDTLAVTDKRHQMSELTELLRLKSGTRQFFITEATALEAADALEDQEATIDRQAKALEGLIEAVRSIALMDEIDAALDHTWAIRTAGAAWRESRQAVYDPAPSKALTPSLPK